MEYKNELSRDDIQVMLEEIVTLTRPDDIPRRITMLQHLLSLVPQQSSPELWATLQGILAISLFDNPQGNRSENIEQAIKHYIKTFEVYTRKDFPVYWAATQNNLGNAYWNRIRGDKAENIEQAIIHYNQDITVRTHMVFPVEWATTQNNLAIAYWNRIRGNRAENIEQAIKHYNQSLIVLKHKDFPVDWARIQDNLATAYSDRIRGDKAENIEQAIEHYNKALEVYTLQDFPGDWATTQNNLAIAYWKRIKGDKAENIEQAIEKYKQALEVRTQMNFPVQWAETQNNLAIAYSDRIRGDKAENIEQAIKHYNQALEVRTKKDLPVDWARTQNNLANVYSDRIRGDKAENIEQAIKYCKQAFLVLKHKDFPVDWAMNQNTLATAYNDRIIGDKAENIEQAIEHYNKALEVMTQKDLPINWAMIQNNLGFAYNDRIRGDKAGNIEQAIEHYNKALEVRTKKDLPVDWATTQNNLAIAYWKRIRGDKAENIEQAIEKYKQALEVRTQMDFPIDWAMIQSNLAAAYSDRIRGCRDENIQKAINYFHSTFEIYKLESMPIDFRRICRFLGDLYYYINQWDDALESYKGAIKAGDLLYNSGLSAESKTVEVGENAFIYQNASMAACRLGLTKEALIIMDGGKTRLLSEALRLKMKKPESIPENEWMKYKQAAEKYRTTTKFYDNKEDYSQREKGVQKALEELDASVKVVQKYDPEFQKALDVTDILSIADNETALMTFCITDKGSIGFVVSGSNGIQSVDIPGFKTKDLDNLLVQKNEPGSITGGWIGDYLSYLDELGTKCCDGAFQAWQETLNNVLFRIGTNLFDQLLEKLPPQTKKIILLPSNSLFLLPLHAVPLSDGQLLCQRYCISYAPSIQLLKEMRNKAGTIEGKGLYAVINPGEDPALVFSGCEGQAISKLFSSYQIDIGEFGTKATVLDRIPKWAYLHFSCHGNYNWNDPPQSGLYLVGGKTLSLADLQNDIVDISSARLVTLSACETGITDVVKGSADEFVGLPAGFMLAGVPCVVSSLWSVPDISTAILMERFYSNHIKKGMDIPLALQDAQLWVRDLTSRQVADYVEKCYSSGKWTGKSIELIEKYREHYLKLAEKSPEEKPFQHPYYWAAFTVNGA